MSDAKATAPAATATPVVVHTAPPSDIPAEITLKIKEWAAKLGKSTEEVTTEFKGLRTMFKTSVPGKTAEWYNQTARRRLYLTIKGELHSPAKPFDVIALGYSAAIDVTAKERGEKEELWEDPETREQAVIEKKVYRFNPAEETTRMVFAGPEKKPVPDGFVLDTRKWMTPPNEEKGEKGRKNPGFGKPLLPRFIRTLVHFGRPIKGGDFKLVSVMCSQGHPSKLPTPPRGKAVRTRINLRTDKPHQYECNQSTSMRFDPIVIPEFPEINDKVICGILGSAPAALRPTIAKLMDWHNDNEKNQRRLVIIEADATFISQNPTAYGSYMMVLEDESEENLEAEGLPCWVPGELKPILDTFGPYSRVFVIGRTNIGEGYDRETRQSLPDVKRVNLNANAIFVVPDRRVAPEEQAVVMPEAKVVQ